MTDIKELKINNQYLNYFLFSKIFLLNENSGNIFTEEIKIPNLPTFIFCI
jgi:hypothetical protein